MLSESNPDVPLPLPPPSACHRASVFINGIYPPIYPFCLIKLSQQSAEKQNKDAHKTFA